jgi:hypothetical protein
MIVAILTGAAAMTSLLGTPPAGAGIRPQAAAATLRATADLRGSDTAVGDDFAGSVAVSGNIIVVGAMFHASRAGRVYVFTKTAPGWRQVAELKGSDTKIGDYFGSSVAVSGTTIAVGAVYHASRAGRVYVFTETAPGWRQVAELKGSDTETGDYFGSSVAVSGNTIVVGATQGPGEGGKAYVFTDTASGWHESAELKGSDSSGGFPGDGFGGSVGISEQTVVVGARAHSSSTGAAYVFSKTGRGWRQVAELKGPSGGKSAAYFGSGVGIDGNTIVVGAPGQAQSGRVDVFAVGSVGWQQSAQLKGPSSVVGDGFGMSVGISSRTVVGYATTGTAYVFTETAGGWRQTAEMNAQPGVGGQMVAVSGSTVVVGSPGPSDVAPGSVYVFKA